MLFKKTSMLNNIIQTALLNVLLNKILPHVLYLFKSISVCSNYYIFIYLIVAVVILFILYKVFKFFKSQKNKSSSKSSISSILSRTSDFDLDTYKMNKLKNKKSKSNTVSKKTLTTDLLSST